MGDPDIPLELVQKILDDADANPDPKVMQLFESYKKQFPRWMTYLCQGFHLLLHGFGSKRKILEEFVNEELAANGCSHLVVRGYNPNISFDRIARTLAENLEIELKSGLNEMEMAETIRSGLEEKTEEELIDLVLVIHNIDGPALRDRAVQNALSVLATAPNIRVIASVDHVNASLLWDQTALSRFGWKWIDVATYDRYGKELVTGESQILGLVSGTGSRKHTMASLESVWASLTQNSRQIFVALVRGCLQEMEKTKQAGMNFWQLFRACRQEFLVSNEAALRHQMVEFYDHHLITNRRGQHDGVDTYGLLVDKKTVLKFLKEKGFENLVPEQDEDNDEN